MKDYKRLTDKKVQGTTERYIRIDKDYILSAYDIITEERYEVVDMLLDRFAELEEQRDRQAYIAEELIQEKHRWTEQARKETAKEILKIIKKEYDYIGELERIISRQFGVEVEG